MNARSRNISVSVIVLTAKPRISSSYAKGTSLKTICSNYAIDNIYNLDEFSLVYEVSPVKTFHFKDDECTRRKLGKIRLIVTAPASMNRQALPVFNSHYQPLPYQHYEDWIRKFQRKSV